MASIAITWNTQRDERVCPICKQLEGYTWVFHVGADILPDILTHPSLGATWSVSQGSVVHSRYHIKYPCRCHFQYKIDFSDFIIKLGAIINELEVKGILGL